MHPTCRPLTVLVLLLGLLLAGMMPSAAATRTDRDPFIAEILALTNQHRTAHGLPPVVWNQAIADISQAWAEEQNRRITKDTFEMKTIHRDGYGSWQIPAGWDWYTENIGINNNARQIVDWWMSSTAHRAGILNPKATDVGLGWMKTTHPDYHGMYVVVENLAGYPGTRADLPPADLSPVREGDVAAVDESGYLYVYPSALGGDLWNRTYLSSGWEDVIQLEVADWNSDGIQDIIARWSDGRLTVHYGQSSGGLSAATTIGSSGWSGYDVEATRWKKDEKHPGLIARHTASGRLYLYANPTGARHGSRTLIGTGFKGMETLTLDYDADGKMDLVARTATGTGQLKLYRSNGSGRFISGTRKIIRSSGFGKFTHLSTAPAHLGEGTTGILGREKSGDLRYFPVAPNKVRNGITIGVGGWDTLTLGS
ncbi:CAP domain-containing protein [Arthrobacter mobilis]|uniref:SCP domain-containing protein n=1 Tax=Arthrobacter mobilis TaxID=2724944 RepID=A0A7X6K7X5_9MICC|nr:CAP domain-containing protein [Arthrobacter mobilis]NKX56828.1 hypothetical protein [Arthrobacter mobilis]